MSLLIQSLRVVHEMESVSVKRKMCYARQENARLAMQDVQLITDLDATPYELLSSSSRVKLP